MHICGHVRYQYGSAQPEAITNSSLYRYNGQRIPTLLRYLGILPSNRAPVETTVRTIDNSTSVRWVNLGFNCVVGPSPDDQRPRSLEVIRTWEEIEQLKFSSYIMVKHEPGGETMCERGFVRLGFKKPL